MTAVMLLGYVIVDILTATVFRMDMRGASATPQGSLHGPMTMLFSLFIISVMGFGATVLGKRFRWYSIATIATVVAFGVVTGLQIAQLAAGQPTPWMGLTERINIYATTLWVALLSIGLLPTKRAVPPRQLRKSRGVLTLTPQSQAR